MLSKQIISGWVRQARYRAKRHRIYSKLSVEDVHAIIILYNEACAYCQTIADTLDSPFPLTDGCPNVAANVVPCCKGCKTLKGNNDLVWLYQKNLITVETYLAIIEKCCSGIDGNLVRDHIKKATGFIEDHQVV